MTVAEQLAASRAAHLVYRQQAGSIDAHGLILSSGDAVAARAAVQLAYDQRLAAHQADLTHADPSWVLDVKASHDDLMAFYRRYLA